MTYINQHHPKTSERLEVGQVDDTAHSDKELLAIALEHFSNKSEKG